MAELVYLLCGATSIGCAVLLLRRYQSSRMRVLFWSGLCFVGLAVNNALLYVDLVVIPQGDLLVLRNSVALAGMLILLFGLVWESQ